MTGAETRLASLAVLVLVAACGDRGPALVSGTIEITETDLAPTSPRARASRDGKRRATLCTSGHARGARAGRAPADIEQRRAARAFGAGRASGSRRRRPAGRVAAGGGRSCAAPKPKPSGCSATQAGSESLAAAGNVEPLPVSTLRSPGGEGGVQSARCGAGGVAPFARRRPAPANPGGARLGGQRAGAAGDGPKPPRLISC
jgi:hypothetical protein